MTDQTSGPSGFDWLNAVWAGSESRGEVTLDSQLVDAKSLEISTQLQAALGSNNEKFAVHINAGGFSMNGSYTIQQVIAEMGKVSKNEVGIVNSEVANMQQEQSLNTQTASQGVQMATNQTTQIDTQNQTNVVQLLSALVSQQNAWGGFQLN